MEFHHRIWKIETGSNDVGCCIPSSPLDIILYQTTSSMPCHHSPWETPRVRQSQAWHGIIAYGQHTRSNYVGRGMPSLPLDNTDGRTTSGVSCYHHPWLTHTVRRHRLWQCHTHTWTAQTIGLRRARHDVPWVAYMVGRRRPWQCHHRTWIAHTVERRQAWHAIITLGKQTRSDDNGHGMLSMFLKSTPD